MVSALMARAMDLRSKVPWQFVADSPTTKYYTDWSLFERSLGVGGSHSFSRPEGEWDLVVGPCGDGYNHELDETLLDVGASKLYAEHVARSAGAYYIDVKGDMRIALCRPEGEGWYSHHLLINVEPGSRSSLLIYAPMGSPGTVGVEVRVKADAKADVALILDPDPRYPVAYLLRRALGVRAELNSTTISSASVMNRIDEGFVISSGALLRHSSFSIARGSERIDNIIDALQTGHDSVAAISGRSVAFDESFTSVRGTVIMTPQATNASSNFVVEALLVGDKAKAYTMPMMRIDTGSVTQASHRAAQYRLPMDELFYLETRGLSEQEAQQVIIGGLADLAIEHLNKLVGALTRPYLLKLLNKAFTPQSQLLPAPS